MMRALWVCFFTGLTIIFLGASQIAYALEPDEVLVIANRNAAKSEGLARFYMNRRQIPAKNLLLLWMTDKETCTRQEFKDKAVVPVRQFIKENPEGKKIRCIVSMYGLPLRVSSPGMTPLEKASLQNLEKQKCTLKTKLKGRQVADGNQGKSIEKRIQEINEKMKQKKLQFDKVASFDSELMLLLKYQYDLNMWIPNPFYLKFKYQQLNTDKSEVLMTSRLDGPSADLVKRIINDGILAEEEGVNGTAYFDARWKDPQDKGVAAYKLYDRSIHRAADYLQVNQIINVIKNDGPELFGKNECPEAVLYCGWYRLANYVDSFTWLPGSVGYHIASQECQTLKGNSNLWCKKMLDNGITATIGPVGEPYVQAFPMPEIFFKYLAEGYLTLAESYIISLPYLSWKMVLVGDPLYRMNLKNK